MPTFASCHDPPPRAAKTEITDEYVLTGLRSIADDTDENGSTRVRSFELLGKHVGMFDDKTRVDVEGAVSVVLESAFAARPAAVPGDPEAE